MATTSNMVLIETKTVGAGGASSIDFTSIPQTYTDLRLVVSARSNRASLSDYPALSFNGLTTNQNIRQLYGNGSGVGSTAESRIFGQMAGGSATANVFGISSFYISNYTSSNYKTVSVDGVMENNATGSDLEILAGLWSSTAAITSLSITSLNSATLQQYSTASLYGVKGASKAAKATGGVISTNGNYVVHTFTSSGTFSPTADLTNVDYLVVGGGGSGGEDIGGGGGAGGFLTGTLSSLATGNYTVTIGAGGPSGRTSGENGGKGTPGTGTTALGLTALPGATGGGEGDSVGGGGSGTYASGGGAGYNSPNSGGAGTAGQGYAGGASSGGQGGGGGGSSAAGAAGVTAGAAGNGGAGTLSNIDGNSYYYAAGGGGSGWTGATIAGNGGIGGGGGGGGVGSSYVNPGTGGGSARNAGGFVTGGNGGAGGQNTGSGGGGAGESNGSTNRVSGAGGSGIVIVRYLA